MALIEAFRATVLSFTRGESTLDDLQDWLASHVQALADEPDHAGQELADEAWIFLEEYSHRRLTKEALQRELAELISIPFPEGAGRG